MSLPRWQVNVVLTPSHNCIKITAELQSNHHSEWHKIQLKGSPVTKDIMKSHTETSRRAEMQNGLVSWPHVANKNRGGNLGCWHPACLRSKVSQPHTTSPRPGFQCQEEKFPSLLAAKNQCGLWLRQMGGLLDSRHSP